MDIWQKDVIELGAITGKEIIKGTKALVEAAQKRIRIACRKQQLVDKMFPGVIRQIAYNKGLKPQPLERSKPTDDGYKRVVVAKVSLEELIEFANKKRIPIRDITERINQEEAEREEKELAVDGSINDEFKEIGRSIGEFKPLKNYSSEYPYQAELAQCLKSRFTNTEIEVQRGSSKPDIVVNGIAIEVKRH